MSYDSNLTTQVQNTNFEEGAEACLALSGLGSLSPNMLLMGFKQDWEADMERTRQYVAVWQRAYKLNLSVLILRTARGLDYSQHILEEELVEAEDLEPVEVLENFSETERARPELCRKISVEPSGERGVVSVMTSPVFRTKEEEGGQE